jgi:hypothetical protein
MEYQRWLRLEKENANLLKKEFLKTHKLEFVDDDELILKYQRGENLSEGEFLKAIEYLLTYRFERGKGVILIDLNRGIAPDGFETLGCRYCHKDMRGILVNTNSEMGSLALRSLPMAHPDCLRAS